MLQLGFKYEDCSLGDVLVDMAVRFVLNVPQQDLERPERLFFQIEEAHWFYLDFVRVANAKLPKLTFANFVMQLFEACPLLKEYSANPKASLNKFETYKSHIPVRGGLILNKDMTKVVLVRAYSFNSWGFPKGKINKGELDIDCAIREVLEETGFDMTNYVRENDYFEIVRSGKNIRLYIARDVPTNTVFETRTRKEISKIHWHKLSNLPVFNSKINSATFSSTVPFLQLLKEHIAAQRGQITSLSSQETAALKSVLGHTSSGPQLESDEQAAGRLLALLQGGGAAPESNHTIPLQPAWHGGAGPPLGLYPGPGYGPPPSWQNHAPLPLNGPPHLWEHNTSVAAPEPSASDREVLMKLIHQGPTDSYEQRVESAQEILGLLGKSIGSEDVATDSAAQVAAKVQRHQSHAKPTEQPKLPTDAALQVLVSSRSAKKSTAGGTSLLSLLKGDVAVLPSHHSHEEDSASLLGLLKNSQKSKSATENNDGNRLLSLLGEGTKKEPVPSTNTQARTPTSVNRLTQLLEDSSVNQKEEDNKVAGNNLMNLLRSGSSEIHSAPPLESVPSKQPVEPIPHSSIDPIADNRLLDLLGSSHNQKKVSAAPLAAREANDYGNEKPKADKKATNDLMSLLQPEPKKLGPQGRKSKEVTSTNSTAVTSTVIDDNMELENGSDLAKTSSTGVDSSPNTVNVESQHEQMSSTVAPETGPPTGNRLLDLLGVAKSAPTETPTGVAGLAGIESQSDLKRSNTLSTSAVEHSGENALMNLLRPSRVEAPSGGSTSNVDPQPATSSSSSNATKEAQPSSFSANAELMSFLGQNNASDSKGRSNANESKSVTGDANVSRIEKTAAKTAPVASTAGNRLLDLLGS